MAHFQVAASVGALVRVAVEWDYTGLDTAVELRFAAQVDPPPQPPRSGPFVLPMVHSSRWAVESGPGELELLVAIPGKKLLPGERVNMRVELWATTGPLLGAADHEIAVV